MGFAFIKSDTSIDFVGKRFFAYIFSIIFILIGIGHMILEGGPKLGIDFAGGVVVQVKFAEAIDDNVLKQSLEIDALPGISTQRFSEDSKEYLLRFSSNDSSALELRVAVENALAKAFPNNKVSIERLEQVGPKVGADLTNKALEAMYYAVLLIAVYISGRFEQRWLVAAFMTIALWGSMWTMSNFTYLGMGYLVFIALAITVGICFVLKLNFALGAIVGLLHDVFITVAMLSLLDCELDLNIVAALLTLIGYSLNDTIIVYDRVRENLKKMQNFELSAVINKSVNQTLSRTILTSGTTIVAALALFVLGGGIINNFALTMLIGVVVGTFSSVYVSSAILLALGNTSDYIRDESEEEYEKPGEHGIV